MDTITTETNYIIQIDLTKYNKQYDNQHEIELENMAWNWALQYYKTIAIKKKKLETFEETEWRN